MKPTETMVKVVAHSVRPDRETEYKARQDLIGCYDDFLGEIVTIVMRYPRIIHSEFMTHRDRARNAASSRAVSVKKTFENTKFRPKDIPSEQKGMQGGDRLSDEVKFNVYSDIDNLCEITIETCKRWAEWGVHKSIINRYLEPFAYIEVVCTSCKWNHFLGLRDASDAEPHFQELAHKIRVALDYSKPQFTEYHCPFIKTDEIESAGDYVGDEWHGIESVMRISAARAAGISYQRPDLNWQRELEICNNLVVKKHSSPLEHPATCKDVPLSYRSGPMVGWKTLRNLIGQDV